MNPLIKRVASIPIITTVNTVNAMRLYLDNSYRLPPDAEIYALGASYNNGALLSLMLTIVNKRGETLVSEYPVDDLANNNGKTREFSLTDLELRRSFLRWTGPLSFAAGMRVMTLKIYYKTSTLV